MKFILSSGYLQKHLQMLSGVINSSNTLPILDNFLFEVDKNRLIITASDLETTMQTELQIESDAQLKIALSAKLLLDILKAIPEQPLTFIVEANNTINLSGNIGKYSISYEDADAFPKLAELENTSEFSIQGGVLATAVQKTIFAAGNDDLRPVMSGVFVQLQENQLTMVATDAHKLVKYTYYNIGNEQEAAIIIPKKPLNLVKSILASSEDSVQVSFNTHNVCFSWDNTKLISRLIDGKY
ncbi:MAG: DNA polymerase III subunit beta, partial [Flavobacteriaceae bacterium]|nr:DNA polymerase III subunit beta [Flavobacteriaceae bacterium]